MAAARVADMTTALTALVLLCGVCNAALSNADLTQLLRGREQRLTAPNKRVTDGELKLPTFPRNAT